MAVELNAISNRYGRSHSKEWEVQKKHPNANLVQKYESENWRSEQTHNAILNMLHVFSLNIPFSFSVQNLQKMRSP